MSEDSSGYELTRRRLLGGVAVTGLATAGAGAGTMAAFVDSEQSTGNTIDAGTLELKISDGDDSGDGVSGTWTISNAKPGDWVKSEVILQNVGSLEADHVELDFSVTETESDDLNGSNESDTKPSSAEGIAEQFEVTRLEYGSDILPSISDENDNNIVDIGDLVSGNDAALDSLNPPPAANGGFRSLDIKFRWAEDSEFDTSVSGNNNDYQGDLLDITVTMALHQESDQNI